MNYEIISTESKEKWQDIEDFKDKYEVSNMGRIRNKITGTIYKFTNQYGDYFTMILYDNTHKRTTRVHREVAKAFIPNPNNYNYINHKDLNKQNNCVENLEWCTQSENAKHAVENGTNIMLGFNKYNKSKCFEKYGYISQYDKQGNFINKFKSAKEASEATKVCARNILQCINNEPKRKSAGGYIWKCEKEVVSSEL